VLPFTKTSLVATTRGMATTQMQPSWSRRMVMERILFVPSIILRCRSGPKTGVPGIPIAGKMAGVRGNRHEKANPLKTSEAKGAGCRRLLQKGGDTADTVTRQMVVRRRSAAG